MPHSFSYAVSMNLEHSIKEGSHERYPDHFQCFRNIKKIKYPDFQAMTYIQDKTSPIKVNGRQGIGACPPPPTGSISFIFAYILPKSVCVGAWHPPMGLCPPQREILDPPLQGLIFYKLYSEVGSLLPVDPTSQYSL